MVHPNSVHRVPTITKTERRIGRRRSSTEVRFKRDGVRIPAELRKLSPAVEHDKKRVRVDFPEREGDASVVWLMRNPEK